MNKKIGVYIHVPFCKGKCAYCDFYSVSCSEERMERYTEALCRSIQAFPESCPADTVYFGGGTPNLLGSARLLRILEEVGKKFPLTSGAEITAEVNPGDDLEDFLLQIRQGGFNRLSVGMQSSNDAELTALGRRHRFRDTCQTVENVQKAGFSRYSLDLMLGIPLQTEESLTESIRACSDLGASHVSAYLLKIEKGTPFAKKRESLQLPEEDTVCGFYGTTCKELEKIGLRQYEISNFARPGEESRHNLKYWLDEEYLGFGPAAHSFYGGRRFYYRRDLPGFIDGMAPVPDGEGGSLEEFLMMRFRLTRGVERETLTERFGGDVFEQLAAKAKKMEPYVLSEPDRIALTREGFLLSNYIIARLLPD